MNIEEGRGRGGYPVSDGRPTPIGQEPLCCGGLGIGWVLFILGFFLGVIPWYIGAVMLCCLKDSDKREKPGFVACAIGAVLATIVIIIVVIVSAANS